MFIGRDANWPRELGDDSKVKDFMKMLWSYFESPDAWFEKYEETHPFLVADKSKEMGAACGLRKRGRPAGGLQFHLKMARLINGTGIQKDVVRRSTFFTELCIAATENLSSKDPAQYRRRFLDKCNREHLIFLDREVFGSNKPKFIFILGSTLWREGFLWLANSCNFVKPFQCLRNGHRVNLAVFLNS